MNNIEPSVEYIIKKINDIKIENNLRHISNIRYSSISDNHTNICISLSNTNIDGDEVRFYRKYNFKIFELFKEIFHEDNVLSEEYPTTLKFRNGSCESIYYDVWNIWINIDIDKWNLEYIQILREEKLKELGL